MAKIMYKGTTLIDTKTVVNSVDIKRIELVTEYPQVEEQGVLYIKIEAPANNNQQNNQNNE